MMEHLSTLFYRLLMQCILEEFNFYFIVNFCLCILKLFIIKKKAGTLKKSASELRTTQPCFLSLIMFF